MCGESQEGGTRLRSTRISIADNVPDGAGEQRRLLAHAADGLPQPVRLQVIKRHSVQQDLPPRRLVQP